MEVWWPIGLNSRHLFAHTVRVKTGWLDLCVLSKLFVVDDVADKRHVSKKLPNRVIRVVYPWRNSSPPWSTLPYFGSLQHECLSLNAYSSETKSYESGISTNISRYKYGNFFRFSFLMRSNLAILQEQTKPQVLNVSRLLYWLLYPHKHFD
jgi:hypothetical protein